jgi:hypothetical protein
MIRTPFEKNTARHTRKHLSEKIPGTARLPGTFWEVEEPR